MSPSESSTEPTTEFWRFSEESWSGREDLNLRPLGPEPIYPIGFPNDSAFSTPGSHGVAISDRRPANTKRLVEPPLRCYCDLMTLKARVKAGRLVVDEPTDLPEGTEVELLPLDPGDWLEPDDRAALDQALRDSDEDVKADRLVDAAAILRELRSR